MKKIPSRERNAILRSLAAGVVPAIGLQHIQVGRLEEVEALIKDLELVEDGSASVRFVVGRFGSGKTFFLNLIRNVALKRKFAVANADITTDRRLQGSGGKAVALYSELMKNLSTQARPEGNALPSIVERWIGEIEYEITNNGGSNDDVVTQIASNLRPLQDLVSGFDFTKVLTSYYEGYLEQNQAKQDQALKWLRGEYSTKTEARQDLGVRSIISDTDVYDYLKLFAAFLRIAGYNGMVVNIDELVVLSHRLNNSQARNRNYEAILRIINDCLQGRVEGLAFLFAGTDECLEDRRRGLFSYEALATRLAPSRFKQPNATDLSSPVIKLQNLRAEDVFVLLSNIRDVHGSEQATRQLIPDEGIKEYLQDCHERMGVAFFQTPRDTVKDFVDLLNALEQNPTKTWKTYVKRKDVADQKTGPSANRTGKSNDELTEFRL
jgi:hypothetical protein